jgi:hypothetical protein
MGNAKSSSTPTIIDEPTVINNDSYLQKKDKVTNVSIYGSSNELFQQIENQFWDDGCRKFKNNLYKLAMITTMLRSMQELISKYAQIDPEKKPIGLEEIVALHINEEPSYSRYSIANEMINKNDDKILLNLHHLWNDVPEIKQAHKKLVREVDNVASNDSRDYVYVLLEYLFGQVLLRFLTEQAENITLLEQNLTQEDIDFMDKHAQEPIYLPSGAKQETQFKNVRVVAMDSSEPDTHSSDDVAIYVCDLKGDIYSAINQFSKLWYYKTFLILDGHEEITEMLSQGLQEYFPSSELPQLLQEPFKFHSHGGQRSKYWANGECPIPGRSSPDETLVEEQTATSNVKKQKIFSVDFDQLLARQDSLLPYFDRDVPVDFTTALSETDLVHIMSFLGVKDICTVSLTNQNMYDVCNSDALWEQLVRQKGIVTPKISVSWKHYYLSSMNVVMYNKRLDWLYERFVEMSDDYTSNSECIVSCWSDQVYTNNMLNYMLAKVT